MLSLAGLRYRNVLADFGGPVQRIDTGHFPVRGRKMILANATLAPGLTNKGRTVLFGAVDGTGVDTVAAVARYKAISEAMERWAFSATVRSERAAEFAFDIDPSTCGLAAFPGLVRRQARRSAVLEGIERYSLSAWWDGLVDAQPVQTDWPGVSAAAIDSPLGGVTVVAWARTEWGGYVYGHAAEESVGAATERAVMELARHEWVLRSRWLATAAGECAKPTNIFEQRCLFFATEEGFEVFQRRLTTKTGRTLARPEVICDKHIPGPWDEYATVWRFSLRPPSDGYLKGGERYFFL